MPCRQSKTFVLYPLAPDLLELRISLTFPNPFQNHNSLNPSHTYPVFFSLCPKPTRYPERVKTPWKRLGDLGDFLFNRRGSSRFLSSITLVLRSVGQICLKRPQALQVTLAGMCPKYLEIYFLVVCTIGQTLAVINVTMLWALVTKVLIPTKDISEPGCSEFRRI
jgi:hypothetical protein